MRDNVSGLKLSEALGITEAAVRAAHKAGRIPRNPDKTYPLEACIKAYAGNTDPAQSRPGRRRKAKAKPIGDTLADRALTTVSQMQPRSEFDAGLACGLVAAQYKIGAAAVAVAKEIGVEVGNADRLKDAVDLAAMVVAEEVMRMVPSWQAIPIDQDIPGLVFDVEKSDQIAVGK